MAQDSEQPTEDIFGIRSAQTAPNDPAELRIANEVLESLTTPPKSDSHSIDPPVDDPMLFRDSESEDRTEAKGEFLHPSESSKSEPSHNRSIPNLKPQPSVGVPELPSAIHGATVSASGAPFTDYDAALHKAATMTAETGQQFAVAPVEGGVVVVPVGASQIPGSPGAHATTPDGDLDAALYLTPIADLTIDLFPQDHIVHKLGLRRFKAIASPKKKHRQSYMSQLTLVATAVFAFLPFLYPVHAISMLFPPESLADITSKIPEEYFIGGFRYFCLFFSVGSIAKILYTRMYFRYILENHKAKRQIGILKKETVSCDYDDLKTVDIQQSLMGRLLNYGTIELSTAASDGSEIVFENVSDPELMQSVIDFKADAESYRVEKGRRR